MPTLFHHFSGSLYDIVLLVLFSKFLYIISFPRKCIYTRVYKNSAGGIDFGRVGQSAELGGGKGGGAGRQTNAGRRDACRSSAFSGLQAPFVRLGQETAGT